MNQWKIYAILIFVMLIWGFNLPSVKYLVEFVDPITLTAFRILTAAATIFVILAGMKLLRLPRKNEWKFILLGALLNVVGHHYFLSSGLALTSGTNAGLILGTGPMLTAVLVSLILRSYPSKLQWIGVVIGLAGVSATVLVGGGETAGMNIGDVFVFLSILVQVLSYIVISKAAGSMDPRLLTAYMFIIGAGVLFIISLIQEPGEIAAFADVPSTFWVAFFFSAVLGTAVGHLLYNYSIGQAGPTKAAIFMNLNTFFSLVGAAVILGEVITTNHLFGLVLIIVGVLFGSGAAEDLLKKRRKRLSL
ncbi:DMT family transporter [Planococcus glaciei]|uniref:DMT family transporter n=1 Tax=Planococcus glaciei TaxID=459472 RepID=UPI0003DF35E2|nr:DMT family transporter [Planococcus glaciei]ETP67778.1 membrane protein [Planococcus glaciei CHR43]MBX0316969.1 DMT family transporter [Planococcus glaciei]SDH88946.1 Permease of the drug/metabolite transporter (DMT) superfamily [Planococcus glaciei]